MYSYIRFIYEHEEIVWYSSGSRQCTALYMYMPDSSFACVAARPSPSPHLGGPNPRHIASASRDEPVLLTMASRSPWVLGRGRGAHRMGWDGMDSPF